MIRLGAIRVWETPELQALNKLPPRATYSICANESEAVASWQGTHTWQQSLDGAWQFHLAASPEAAAAWLEFAAATDASWSAIQVPGNWELQGFGRPHYTNVQMPFVAEPPRVPDENPTGVYRRTFELDPTWKGKRIVLHFGGADSVLLLYVNGSAAGLSKDSRLPAEFDVTELVRWGEVNTITAIVIKWSDASYVEDQDMWWLAGLSRSVTIYATPRTYLADLRVVSQLAPEGRGGHCEITALLGARGTPPENCRISVRLLDPAGRVVWAESSADAFRVDHEARQPDRLRLVLACKLPKVEAWSAETPRLYTAIVHLQTPDGDSHVAVRTGFRRVEIVGRDILINGRRVIFHGVNRHEHHETCGKAVPFAAMLEDVKLMKRFNFNAVRCSHYPNDPRWLSLCDEFGLYVIDEANIESHAFHNQLCRDPRFATAWLDRTMRMVIRDQNHPCVIAWSLGNESGFGPNHHAAAGWVRGYDRSRLVIYEGAVSGQSHRQWSDGIGVTDVVCPMYPELERVRAWSKAGTDPRPLLLCEYSHAMGNSNGSLDGYFELFHRAPGVQGGFIWEWCDHGLRRDLGGGRWHHAYGGDFGDVPNDANFVCDGLVSANREARPALWEHKHLAQPVEVKWADRANHVIAVTNRQHFATLAGLRGVWELRAEGEVVRCGRLPARKVRPGETAKIPLRLGRLLAQARWHLVVRFMLAADCPWAEAGHEVAWAQLAFGPESTRRTWTRRTGRREASLTVDDDRIVLRAADTVVTVDRQSGDWLSWRVRGVEMLHATPRLQLWRAATDNDGVRLWSGQENKPLGRWRALDLDQPLARRLQAIEWARPKARGAWIRVRQELSARGCWRDCRHETVYRMSDDGVIEAAHAMVFGSTDMIDLPRVGIRLDVDAEFARLRYHGLGPWETYPDRCAGAIDAVHASTVAAEYVPYTMPQEHGHHTDVRWLELTAAGGRGVRVEGRSRFGFNATRYSAEALYAARHTSDLMQEPATVLYLDAAHRGLGSGSCGPDALPEFRLLERKYRLDLRFSAIG